MSIAFLEFFVVIPEAGRSYNLLGEDKWIGFYMELTQANSTTFLKSHIHLKA